MSKFKIEKDYHRRKLLIIELIQECEKRIFNEKIFMKKFDHYNMAIDNSLNNISRYNKIAHYLQKRYEA